MDLALQEGVLHLLGLEADEQAVIAWRRLGNTAGTLPSKLSIQGHHDVA